MQSIKCHRLQPLLRVATNRSNDRQSLFLVTPAPWMKVSTRINSKALSKYPDKYILIYNVYTDVCTHMHKDKQKGGQQYKRTYYVDIFIRTWVQTCIHFQTDRHTG